MTRKLLFTFLSFSIFSASYAQQEATSYVSGLEEPSAIVSQGTMLYTQGYDKIYQVNTAATTPTATVIYDAPANFYMSNMAISGNTMYITEENYIEATDTYVGSRIVALNLTNTALPVTVVHVTTQYVSALAIKGNDLYFSAETTPDADDNFTVQVKKLDVSQVNPVATVVVAALTTDYEATDMAFYSNNLLISVGGNSKVFGFDITDSPIVVTDYLSGLNFNKGIFVNGTNIFTAEGNFIKMKDLNAPTAAVSVAKNTTYQDSNGGTPFFANFRDAVLIGDKLYMTLLNQGRIMMVQDSNLSAETFSPANAVSIYNSKTQLTVNGLKNSHAAIIYNLAGQRVGTKQLSADENAIDISALSEGVYLLKLDNQKAFKFIK